MCHKRRNDSIVTDTVTGVYKSTLTCPACATPWRKFDPFNSLELPLPLKSSRSLRITLVRRVPACLPPPEGHDAAKAAAACSKAAVPEVFAVEVTQRSTIIEVRAAVGALAGVDPELLILWEVYGGKVFQALTEARFPAYKIAASDVIIASLLPAEGAPDDTGLLPIKPKAAKAAKVGAKQGSGKDDGDDESDESDENEENEEADGGEELVVVLHRKGGNKEKRGFGLRGGTVVAADFFGEPLVLKAKLGWSLSDFKRHCLAQLAHLLEDPARTACLLASELKVAQLTSFRTGQALVARSGRVAPLADHFYGHASDGLTLGAALARCGATYVVALEWSEAAYGCLASARALKRLQAAPSAADDDDSDGAEEDEGAVAARAAAVRATVAAAAAPPRREHASVGRLRHLEEALTLQRCFDLYCKDEKMEQGDEYYCGKCKTHRQCVKSMRLARCPEVLIVTLKRFGKQLGLGSRFLPDKLQDLVRGAGRGSGSGVCEGRGKGACACSSGCGGRGFGYRAAEARLCRRPSVFRPPRCGSRASCTGWRLARCLTGGLPSRWP